MMLYIYKQTYSGSHLKLHKVQNKFKLQTEIVTTQETSFTVSFIFSFIIYFPRNKTKLIFTN